MDYVSPAKNLVVVFALFAPFAVFTRFCLFPCPLIRAVVPRFSSPALLTELFIIRVKMSVEVADPEAAARATLALLETRLHRLEFLLTGKSDDSGRPYSVTAPANANGTIRTKLNVLEDELKNLKNLGGPAGTVLRDIDRLCMS